jgi:citrate lyase subunit beta/citryl-CoA lyase
VPGDAPDKLAKALDRGADALIVDLEDAVRPERKDAARAAVADWLRGVPPGARVWVRINPGPAGHADARAVVGPGLRGVCVAKAGSAAELATLSDVLAAAEAAVGLPTGTGEVAPLLETAAAVLAAAEIARAPRVTRLQLGEADLCAELGIEPGPDARELLWIRSQAVLASAAAGIGPPVGPVWTDVADLDGLRACTVALRRLGFRGRACIHPAQLAVVHEVFTPGAAEVAAARDVLARFEEAAARGLGVCVDARGRLVDEAVVRSARRVLATLPPPG